MHSLQQEKIRDIINSRHLAFPVKMADIHQAMRIAGFHVHSGLVLRGFFHHVSVQLAHVCILSSSSTAKHSSSCWPSDYSKPVKPIATTSPCPLQEYAEKWLDLAWLPVPLGAAVDNQHMLQGCCSTSLYCGFRDPEAKARPCCCSLLCWPGNSTKGV